jgi:hypothetical protein
MLSHILSITGGVTAYRDAYITVLLTDSFLISRRLRLKPRLGDLLNRTSVSSRVSDQTRESFCESDGAFAPFCRLAFKNPRRMNKIHLFKRASWQAFCGWSTYRRQAAYLDISTCLSGSRLNSVIGSIGGRNGPLSKCLNSTPIFVNAVTCLVHPRLGRLTRRGDMRNASLMHMQATQKGNRTARSF